MVYLDECKRMEVQSKQKTCLSSGRKELSRHKILRDSATPVHRRDYMDLDEFLMIANGFESYKKVLPLKESQSVMNLPPQAFPGANYNSLLNYLAAAQGYRDVSCPMDKKQDLADSCPRPRSSERSELCRQDDDYYEDDSRDSSFGSASPGERHSQAVSVIVSEIKDHDEFDSGEDSVDSGITSKSSSQNGDLVLVSRSDGGGKVKSRRRRKAEYVYNPLPVGRKSTRKFVPTDKKDDRYWEQRIKNNIAAKRSREARRQKEMEILNRCQGLVSENESLKEQNNRLQCKIDELERRLELYSKMVSSDNVLLVKV